MSFVSPFYWMSTADSQRHISLTDDKTGALVGRCTTEEWLTGIHEFSLPPK